MAAIKEYFQIPSKMKAWSLGLMAVGLIALLVGLFTKGFSDDQHTKDVFWATLMYNCIFFTLVCNAAMFFICITTLAMGGWQIVFRRVSEAISTLVPIFGVITFAVLMYIVFGMGEHTHIYHWLDTHHAEADPILKGKLGFLNSKFYLIWSLLTIGLWIVLGARMRKLGNEADDAALRGEEVKRSYIWRSTVSASLFIVWFALTVGSTIHWLWVMSIDAHWYSTMFSWYSFASTFVSGIALIALWVIYLKNKGYLEYVNQEHLHDLGKFMFAFSIFWTYLWFSQYMLIWYSNQPEETIYFINRIGTAAKPAPFKGLFFLNLIINFVCPLLILMKRSSKRNYTLVAFMSILIIFGHWLDYYQMVMGSVSSDHVTLGWLDFGIMAFFVGAIIFFTSRALASKPLVQKYHPFLKESIIHHT